MPIYYVIMEQVFVNNMIPLWHIIKVIECDLSDYNAIYEKEMIPLVKSGRRVQVMFFYREPDNPFKEQVKE